MKVLSELLLECMDFPVRFLLTDADCTKNADLQVNTPGSKDVRIYNRASFALVRYRLLCKLHKSEIMHEKIQNHVIQRSSLTFFSIQ